MLKTSFSEYNGTASGNKYSLPLTAILPTLESGVSKLVRVFDRFWSLHMTNEDEF